MHTQPTSSALQGRSKQVQYMQFCPWGGSTYWPDQHRRPDPARHCFASSTMCACGLSVHLTFIQYREKLLPVLDTASPVSAYVLIILCDNFRFQLFPADRRCTKAARGKTHVEDCGESRVCAWGSKHEDTCLQPQHCCSRCSVPWTQVSELDLMELTVGLLYDCSLL